MTLFVHFLIHYLHHRFLFDWATFFAIIAELPFLLNTFFAMQTFFPV